ncbi:MAG: hypothetical protein ACLFQV_03540 [Vulcanimicrobiota bacterium]
MKKFGTLFLILFVFSLVLTPVFAGDNYIVGGKRVGPILIGKPLSQYEHLLGNRATINPSFFDFPQRKIAILVDNSRNIKGIMVYFQNYKTKQGVKVGMPVSALNKHYGNYLKTDAGSLVYSELGLAFNEKSGNISRIMVVQSTPDTLLGDKMIVPGVRAGNIKIGMEIEGVKKYWGEPKSAEPLKGNQKIIVYNYENKAVKILVGDGIVHGLQINSYKYQTPEGIGIDSSKDKVVKTYGNRYSEVENSLMYNSLGVGFYIHKDKVLEILVTYKK